MVLGVGSACAGVVEVRGMIRRAEEGARELRAGAGLEPVAGGGEGEGWRGGASEDMSLVCRVFRRRSDRREQAIGAKRGPETH